MVRKQVYIQERHDHALKELSNHTGRAEAELIREAIERMIGVSAEPARDMSEWEAAVRFMEERARTVKVSPQARTWTREDLYDRKVLRGR